MKSNKLLLVFLIGSAFSFYELYLKEDAAAVEELHARKINFNNENDAVLMVGCKTFNGPEKPKVVYPTVQKKFLALTCALEVPPHYGVVALERIAMQKEKETQ